jgi:hypothetical protein
MSGIQATKLEFGFFNGIQQWLHINNIKIINSNGDNIMLNTGTTVTQTSTSTIFQSSGDLKTILTDNNATTFSHTERLVNQNITVNFDRPHTVVQIIINNRENNDFRIRNAQFKLWMNDKNEYVSDLIDHNAIPNVPADPNDTIYKAKRFYYIFPPNKTIYNSDTEPLITTPSPATTIKPYLPITAGFIALIIIVWFLFFLFKKNRMTRNNNKILPSSM